MKLILLKTEEEAPRYCDVCGKGMWEGFCINGGMAYYCRKKCLKTVMTWKEWKKLYNGGDGNSYWTTWELEDVQT